MKLEVGKHYRTQDGHRAYVGYESGIPKAFRGIAFYGHVSFDDETISERWDANGYTLLSNGERDPAWGHDLIAEWKDAPKPIKRLGHFLADQHNTLADKINEIIDRLNKLESKS